MLKIGVFLVRIKDKYRGGILVTFLACDPYNPSSNPSKGCLTQMQILIRICAQE